MFIVLELETWCFFASLLLVQHQLLLQVISFTKPHLARADCTEWVWRCSEVVFCVLDGKIIRLKCNAQIYIWVVLKLSIVFLFTVSNCRGYEKNSWGIIGLFLLFTVRVQIYGGWNGLNFHLMFSGRKGESEKREKVISGRWIRFLLLFLWFRRWYNSGACYSAVD